MHTTRIGLVVALALAGRAGAQPAGELASLLERTAPSIVTVKVVIKTEVMMMGQSQNEETRADLQGVVVDSGGLIMISNAEISAERMKDTLSGIPNASMMDFKVTPTDFKVVFGNEQEEYSAFLVAKDTKLDLAFVQVEDLPEEELVPVSFADSVKPAIGAAVVSVSRLKQGFDYAPYLASARISGSIRKPRKAWTVDGNLSGYGLPVFTPAGDTAGVLITLAPTKVDESSAAGGFGSFMRFMRGGGLDTGPGTFVLPGGVVNGLIEQARTQARELQAEHAADAEEPADQNGADSP